VREPALRVKMPGDVIEGDQSSASLQRVQPILNPGIKRDVGIPAEPNVDAITAVIEHRMKNNSPFDERPERNRLQLAGDGVVFFRRDENGAVGPEMFGKECANRDNAGKRMQLSEQITRIRLGCRRRHVLSAADDPEFLLERC
jgi:hypothetical protein